MFQVGEKNAEPHVVMLRNNGMSAIRYGTTCEVCSFYPHSRVGLVQLLYVNRAANGQLIAGGLGVERRSGALTFNFSW